VWEQFTQVPLGAHLTLFARCGAVDSRAVAPGASAVA